VREAVDESGIYGGGDFLRLDLTKSEGRVLLSTEQKPQKSILYSLLMSAAVLLSPEHVAIQEGGPA